MISKMIVEHFNGIIDFASEYNKGSVFYFTFETDQIVRKDMSTKNLAALFNEVQDQKIPQFKTSISARSNISKLND